MPSIKYVLFDMDGVVIQSHDVWHKSIIETEKKFNVSFARLSGEQTEGWATRDVLNFLFEGDQDLIKASNQYINEVFKAYLGKLGSMTEGMISVLQMLKDTGRKVALVSNSEREIVDFVLEFYGIQSYFDTTVTCDDVVLGKPNPAIYKLGLERLNGTLAEAIAVEDSIAGMRAATGAGLRTILFHQNPVEEVKAMAYQWVKTPADIIDIVK